MKNLRIAFSMLVFTGSYLPLFLLLFAQSIDFGEIKNLFNSEFWKKDSVLILYAILFLISLISIIISTMLINYESKKINAVVIKSKNLSLDMINYLTPYLLSFVVDEIDTLNKNVCLFIFLICVFAIVHKSGRILYNPLLIFLGWYPHEIEFKQRNSDVPILGHALSKKRYLTPGSKFKYCEIQQIMLIQTNNEEVWDET